MYVHKFYYFYFSKQKMHLPICITLSYDKANTDVTLCFEIKKFLAISECPQYVVWHH